MFFICFLIIFSSEEVINRRVLENNDDKASKRLNTEPIIFSATVFLFALAFFIVLISYLLYKKSLKLAKQKRNENDENAVAIIQDVTPISHDVTITWSTENNSDDPFRSHTTEGDELDDSRFAQENSQESDFYMASDFSEVI